MLPHVLLSLLELLLGLLVFLNSFGLVNTSSCNYSVVLKLFQSRSGSCSFSPTARPGSHLGADRVGVVPLVRNKAEEQPARVYQQVLATM